MFHLECRFGSEGGAELMPTQDALLSVCVDEAFGGSEGGGEELRAVVRSGVGEVGREGQLHVGEVVAKLVPRAQSERAVIGYVAAALVGVAIGEEVCAVGGGLQVALRVGETCVALCVPLLAASIHVVVEAPLLLGGATGFIVPLPVVVLARTGVVVQVVGIGIDCQMGVVGEAHGEETCQVSLVGAASCLEVGQIADAVFLLQFHVHHVGFVTFQCLL